MSIHCVRARRGHLLLACAGLALANIAVAQEPAGPVPAQPTPAEAPPEIMSAEVDPKAKEVLDRAAAFYEKLPGSRVTVKMSVAVPGEEGEQTQDTNISMAAADPNRFVFPLETGGQYDQFKIVSTGETVYMFFGAPMNKYSAEPAPADYSGVIDAISMGHSPDLHSLATPMYPVLRLMQGKTLADHPGVSKVEFGGEEELDGKAASRVKLIGSEADVEVWILKGEEPWVVQIKPDMTKGLAELGEMGEQLKATMPRVTVGLSNWESKAEFPETTFAFTPPEGAEKVDSLMKALEEMRGGGEAGESGHTALLGKPAPAINLAMLDGGKATLEDAKGKVVILDFWATWCPPCVKGLPVVSGLAAKYKDKGVVFYAVNEQEDEATIRAFLEKRELKIPVALDTDGALGSSYLVTGIPQTVLIGKDGTVQVVHVGFMPSMEEELAKQIEALIEGKNLAEEAKNAEPAEPVPAKRE